MGFFAVPENRYLYMGTWGETSRPRAPGSSMRSIIPHPALSMQSSMERPTPVNPYESGEKKPKKSGFFDCFDDERIS